MLRRMLFSLSSQIMPIRQIVSMAAVKASSFNAAKSTLAANLTNFTLNSISHGSLAQQTL